MFMKYFKLLIPVLAIFFCYSCECSKTTAQHAVNINQTNNSAMTSGKVSHIYRATGCKTVIIINNSDEALTLIPSVELPGEFDKDGLEIFFNYRLLKMPNPEGCSVGLPAELSDVAIK